MAIEVLAPAKVNLALHITGKRDDGYHLLDTLVAFGPAADRLTLTRADALSLQITGPEGQGLDAGEDNLVMKAARLVAGSSGAAITLEKRLPVASGIGGGSSDAAAALRGLLMLHDASDEFGSRIVDAPDDALRPVAEDLLQLGADVPMCLMPRGLRAGGIGEKISPVDLPPLPCLLVNPRVPVATADVFCALSSPNNPPLPETLPDFTDAGTLIDWLADQRNDLQAPAIEVAPIIGDVLAALEALPGCGLARMSGSGATCFALFRDAETAKAAGTKLQQAHPQWWLAGGFLGDREAWIRPVERD